MGLPNVHASQVQGLGSHDFYIEQATTNSYVEIPFVDQNTVPEAPYHFTSYSQILKNTGANEADFSFDGTTLHGQLASGASIAFDRRHKRSIWIKATSAGNQTTLRVYAW